MHEVEVKGILSGKDGRYGMNLYRGCSHGCIYCDSRSDCYQMKHPFEDIEVKKNAIKLLEQALARKRKKCMIGTGAMCDPYIPLEMELEYTRSALELIDKYRFGVTLITKSDRILRDLPLLKKINQQTRCVVQMTLTTADDALCKKIEPGVCVTSERARALNILRDNGIPTVVWLTPILPFINDTEENLQGLLDDCIEARVRGVLWFGAGVTLRDGQREYFYRSLDRLFPGMKARYMETFGNQYVASSPNDRRLSAMVRETCRQHGILWEPEKVFAYLNEFEDREAGEQLGFLT